MNNKSLDQKLPNGTNKVSDTPANVQNKSHSITPKDKDILLDEIDSDLMLMYEAYLHNLILKLRFC